MVRSTIKDVKKRRIAKASADERVAFDETYAAVALAISRRRADP